MKRFSFIIFLQIISFHSFSSNLFNPSPSAVGAQPLVKKTAIAIDKKGYKYITGCFSGAIDFGRPGTGILSITGYGIFVAKYNKTGKCEWVEKAEGSAYSYGPSAITVDTIGNVFITGSFVNTLKFYDRSILSKGGPDLFVAMFNKEGDLGWVGRGGSTQGDVGNGIALGPKGELYVVGSFKGTPNLLSYDLSYATFESGENSSKTVVSNNGSSDIFIAKYNRLTGEILRIEKDGGPKDEFATDLKINSNGIYISGKFLEKASFGKKNLKSLGGWDGFIVRYDLPDFKLNYARQIGGSSHQSAKEIGFIDHENNVYLLGSFEGTTMLETSETKYVSKGKQDIFVAKYDAKGIVKWVNTAGGPSTDIGNFIGMDELSNVYVQGELNGAAKFSSQNKTDVAYAPEKVNLFLAKYNVEGTLAWVKEAPMANAKAQNTVWTEEAGDPIGTYENGIMKNIPDELVNNTSVSGINAKVHNEDEDDESGSELIAVYPNPSSDGIFKFQYYLGASSKALVEVFDMAGKSLHREEVNNIAVLLDKALDLRTQPKGVYLLQIIADKQTIRKKIEIK